MIPFTQYVRQNGERRATGVDRSDEIEAMAHWCTDLGARFECEVLTTGLVSITMVHPDFEDEGDIAIALASNGPDRFLAVDKVVREGRRRLEELLSTGGLDPDYPEGEHHL